MKTGRRSFLKGVGGATAAAFALRGETAAAAAAPSPGVGARQVLELEGQAVGAPQSAEGGGASAVVNGFLDSGLVVRKDVVDIRYEALRLEVGLGMSAGFFDWVRAFFHRDFQRKDGALVTTDFNFQERARREFQDALITEVSFPTLDASSKDAAFLTVGIQPESSHFELAKGGKVQLPTSKAKKWLAGNFKVELDGLESATKRISKVDAFAVKMKLQQGQTSLFDFGTYLEVPNIVLTVPLVDIEPFLDWFEDFVVKGDNGPESEKSGAIVCLSPNLKDELLRIELSQVGIVSIGESKQEANKDSVKRFQVEMYVEEMELNFK